MCIWIGRVTTVEIRRCVTVTAISHNVKQTGFALMFSVSYAYVKQTGMWTLAPCPDANKNINQA